jgi:hypothetical protein
MDSAFPKRAMISCKDERRTKKQIENHHHNSSEFEQTIETTTTMGNGNSNAGRSFVSKEKVENKEFYLPSLDQ